MTGGTTSAAARSRILLIAEVFPPRLGGSGRWLWELYRRQRDLAISVLAGSTAGDADFDRGSSLPTERTSLRFSSWGLLTPSSAVGCVRAAGRAVRRARSMECQAIHCGKCLPEGLIALLAQARLRIPYWCYAHGEELTLAETSRELKWLTNLVLRRAERVIANSENTRRLLEERWPGARGKTVALPPAVDTTRFAPASSDDAFRAHLGWTGRRVVLTVGALQKRKGQDMMIRALPAIRARCPDVLYAVAGEGWERDYLEGLVKDHGVESAVQFLGAPADDDLVRYYQQCDVFALPNRQIGWDFEGFGIVLLEAQSCGRPVIAGASGGTAEAMLPSETGLRIGCDEPGPLADAVITLLEDREGRLRMGARARSWAVERFDWSVRAEQARRMFVQDGRA